LSCELREAERNEMFTSDTPRPSGLIEYLPAIYHDDALLGRFLRAFEDILIGGGDGSQPGSRGLEQTIADIPELFNPRNTEVVKKEFLPWLASWTAFTLRADLSEAVQREFIAKIIQRYRLRGTLKNLQELLEIFVQGNHEIIEFTADEMQVGRVSTVGVDTWLAGSPPHFFQVTISLPRLDPETIERQKEIAAALIELEKPAHTNYALNVNHPSIQIGVFSTVGVDTLIGN
jgi:phage tail-like protein